ncbi:MAG TPA: CaiB/BaiF CoA-transferase family protein [Acidimicrobiales bacterium]|nr:CaiB/BaiF CoA-transferase family protein [Acidimicrobiales bacterium]
MRLGDVVPGEGPDNGKPLDGIRVLAAEQMQALPYATQLLGRLGAHVVKVEHPVHGESGRGATPAMEDPKGRTVGATFLRNNLSKKSVGLDLKAPAGKQLFLDLVPQFDVVAENFKAGTMDRLGLGYEDVRAVHPGVIYVSVSGFGNRDDSPYREWPAYASIVEAMSGIYAWAQRPGEPPRPNPVGALGDISSALFGVIGILAALRHRDRTGVGQYVDIAMLDAVVAMTDVVSNLWSLGQDPDAPLPMILDAFATKDGYLNMQVVREHQFAALVTLIGRPEWVDDPRFAERLGWAEYLESDIRPAIEAWLADKTRLEATHLLSDVGIAAGPVHTSPEIIADEHVAKRHMIVEMERTDGVADPVLIPGNPVKLSAGAEGPETRIPWVGEHTTEVLQAELGLSGVELDQLRADGVIT